MRKAIQPPRWADRILEWYCDPKLLDEIQGDLHEAFYSRLESKRKFKAKLFFIKEVFQSLRWENRKSRQPSTNLGMLNNYFKIAIRNFGKQKLYSFINVFGLALGIACVLLLTLFVLNEKSYDQFHTKQDRLFRVVQRVTEPDGKVIEHSASIPWAVGPAMHTDYPDAPNVRMYKAWQKSPLIKYENLDKGFYEQEVFFVDTTFFNIFTFPLIKGNPATALQHPQSVVLTESIARKYFGEADPMGKTLRLENSMDLTVTGVAKDVPPNSHFHFDFLIPLLNIGDIFEATGNQWGWRGWYWNPVHTYVLLPDRYSETDFNNELKNFVTKNFPEGLRDQNELYVQPLSSIHLHSNLYQEIEPGRSESSIHIAISIAAFILLIASINFVNLTTARSTQRAKEVGMRKVMGSTRDRLVVQFFSESILVCLLSFLLSLLLIGLFLPAFEMLVNAQINLAYLVTPKLVIMVVAGVLLLGLLAGSYPALLLSSFEPVKILKSSSGGSGSGFASLFRKSLVVLQFTISVVLVVSTIIIYQQHHFLTEKNLGFEKDEIVMIPIQGTVIRDKRKEFKDELKKNSQVVAACAISDILGQDVPNRPFGFVGYDAPQDTPGLFTDHDFAETFGVKLLGGRDFNEENENDQYTFLINESLRQNLKDPVWENQPVKWGRQDRPIIGLVEDFHFADLRQPIKPLLIGFADSFLGYIAVRVKPGDVVATIKALDNTWRVFEPERPFVPFFLNDELNQLYKSEQNMGDVVSTFSMLAIAIACLGLFGLATYSVNLRVKEIGIRKVLGAGASNIVTLITKDFILLIVLANALAWPLAWYTMDIWLDTFVYRTNISWWIFALVGFVTMMAALLTTGFQSLRAASLNPTDIIKEE